MSFVSFLGPCLIGVGPLFVIFVLFIARKSFLVLLTLASVCYWLVFLLILASIFRPFTPLSDNAGIHAMVLIISILLEQAVKFLLFKFSLQIIDVLQEVGRKTGHGFTALDAIWISFGLGFGQALTHGTFFFVGVLESTSVGASHYIDSCHEMSFFLASSLLTLAFGILHLFSTIVFFRGLTSKNWVQIGAPPFAHLVAGLVTLGNFAESGCVVVIPLNLCIALLICFWALSITWNTIKIQFPRERTIT